MKKWNLVQWGLLGGVALMSLSTVAKADSTRIIGGSTVKASDPVASSTVLLLANAGTQDEYLCTGSLIDTDIVVTAAHCVAADADKIQIVFGLKVNASSWEPTSADQVLNITGYIANPNYKGENYQGDDMGDIAIIRLNGTLPDGYSPATILPASETLSAGETTLLAGYGISSAKTQKGAGTLRKVNATIQGTVGKTEIAIDETNRKGSCSGDSGGPAFIQKGSELYLWGATSRGDADCAQEGIYTNITTYTSWIAQAEKTLRAKN